MAKESGALEIKESSYKNLQNKKQPKFLFTESQARVFIAAARLLFSLFDKRFLMLSSGILVNDNIKIIDVNINSLNDDISTQKEIERENEIKKKKEKEINITFDEFWLNYKGKKQERVKCCDKWNKLKDSDRELIMQHLPIYEKEVSDIKYLKHTLNYLNSKIWLDIKETENNYRPKKELSESEILRSCGVNI